MQSKSRRSQNGSATTSRIVAFDGMRDIHSRMRKRMNLLVPPPPPPPPHDGARKNEVTTEDKEDEEADGLAGADEWRLPQIR